MKNPLLELEPHSSKLRAAIEKGLKLPIKEGDLVLYLGAAEGNTASRVADFVGNKESIGNKRGANDSDKDAKSGGAVFCVEVAPKPFEKLLKVCESRKNMVPILADANRPEKYAEFLPEKVDVVFQDISQKNQAEIFLKNVKLFLKTGGVAMIAIKAACIDTTAEPEDVFKREIEKLKKEMGVREVLSLEPFERGHVLVVCDCINNRELVLDF